MPYLIAAGLCCVVGGVIIAHIFLQLVDAERLEDYLGSAFSILVVAALTLALAGFNLYRSPEATALLDTYMEQHR